MMANKRYLFLGLLLVSFVGCASHSPNSSYLGEMEMIQGPTPPDFQSPRIEGRSLWSEEMGVALYSDFRARRVEDIVTVRIVEDPKAELNANTKTSRSSSLAQNPGEDDLIK